MWEGVLGIIFFLKFKSSTILFILCHPVFFFPPSTPSSIVHLHPPNVYFLRFVMLSIQTLIFLFLTIPSTYLTLLINPAMLPVEILLFFEIFHYQFYSLFQSQVSVSP